MAEFRISFDLDVVLDAATAAVNEELLPQLAQAVRTVAQQTQVRWMEAVYQARLWNGEKTAYMESIQLQQTGPFSWLVHSDYKYAEEIENGRPARDLKRMLDTSLKVRTAKDGTRYLYIPLRHNAPGNDALAPSMPQHIYDQAKKLKTSSVTGKTTRLSGTGAYDIKSRKHLTVPQNTYQWGGRLTPNPAANPVGAAGWNLEREARIYSGMYRFTATTPGGKKSSQYLTFRTMSEKSSGWIVPAQPGLHLAENVANEMRPLAEQAFTEAVKRSG